MICAKYNANSIKYEIAFFGYRNIRVILPYKHLFARQYKVFLNIDCKYKWVVFVQKNLSVSEASLICRKASVYCMQQF